MILLNFGVANTLKTEEPYFTTDKIFEIFFSVDDFFTAVYRP